LRRVRVKPGFSHEKDVSRVGEDKILDDGRLVHFRGDRGSRAGVAEGNVEVIQGRRAGIRVYIAGEQKKKGQKKASSVWC
jgi:hypothetical protein